MDLDDSSRLSETLSEEERKWLAEESAWDPVFFLRQFLRRSFSLPVPWLHRGVLAILLRKTKFLLAYGDLRKTVQNFEFEQLASGQKQKRRIFSVRSDGRELTDDELAVLDQRIRLARAHRERVSQQMLQEIAPQVEIKISLGSNVLLEMPRGIAKTSLAGFAVPLYNILFQLERFILYVSQASDHPKEQLASIKRELSQNELILQVFGDLRPTRSEDERWSAGLFETLSGVAMAARGKGGQVRGSLHNNQRPSMILVDDPQSLKDVESETQREKDIRWAYADLMPAKAQVSGSGQQTLTVFLGTKIHRRSVVGIVEHDPRWVVCKFGTKDKDGDWIWPAYMSEVKYEIEKSAYANAGLLHLFYLEYENEDIPDEVQIFPYSFLKVELAPEGLIHATYIDPAFSEKRTADFTHIVTCGLNPKTGKIHVRCSWMKRTTKDEDKLDEYFRQILTYGSLLTGYEANGAQAAFGNTVREAMFRRGHYFEPEAVTHKASKISRIRGALRPRLAAGHLVFDEEFQLLWQQLQDFRADGSHEHDDGPDGLAACVTLLDPAAAAAAGRDLTTDEYPSLEEELGDWRSAS